MSSERRAYIPAGFVTNGMIPGDKLYFIPTDNLYIFGIFMSRFHNAWMRAIAGRLKSDYSYANTIVYNNFIWPEPTDEQRHRIEKCAQVVLDARQLYQCPAGVPDNNDITAEPAATLADLYDPDNDFLYPAAHTGAPGTRYCSGRSLRGEL